jgi:hypothetical protein
MELSKVRMEQTRRRLLFSILRGFYVEGSSHHFIQGKLAMGLTEQVSTTTTTDPDYLDLRFVAATLDQVFAEEGKIEAAHHDLLYEYLEQKGLLDPNSGCRFLPNGTVGHPNAPSPKSTPLDAARMICLLYQRQKLLNPIATFLLSIPAESEE